MPKLSHNFKDLCNCLADQFEILCGASLDSGIEILFAISCSHDKDSCHAMYGHMTKIAAMLCMVKSLQKSFSPTFFSGPHTIKRHLSDIGY